MTPVPDDRAAAWERSPRDIERLSRSDFAARAREAFGDDEAAQILRAASFAADRVGDLEEHLRVARILLGQRADPVVLTAAVLAPLRRHGRATSTDLRRRFGAQVADLVDKAFSEERLRSDRERHRREDTSALLRRLASDARATVLRLGLRLAELERLAETAGAQAEDLARETLDLHVLLADRMGMRHLCRRLEDACFRLLEPDSYRQLARAVEPIRDEDRACLELLCEGVDRILGRNGIRGTVHGRAKGLYSLHRKMRRTGKSLVQIMDRVGLRIVIHSVRDCYTTLGLLHTHFQPVPGTFDDYIGLPKDNGYQSLHTCVYPVPGVTSKPVEFQVRTEVMDREAEYGIAAHWLYKTEAETRRAGREQMRWLGDMADRRDAAGTHGEFIAELRERVFGDHIVVFGPEGRRVRLPSGSAVGDLAEHLHHASRPGTVALVNGRERGMDHPLRDGDTVELAGGIE